MLSLTLSLVISGVHHIFDFWLGRLHGTAISITRSKLPESSTAAVMASSGVLVAGGGAFGENFAEDPPVDTVELTPGLEGHRGHV